MCLVCLPFTFLVCLHIMLLVKSVGMSLINNFLWLACLYRSCQLLHMLIPIPGDCHLESRTEQKICFNIRVLFVTWSNKRLSFRKNIIASEHASWPTIKWITASTRNRHIRTLRFKQSPTSNRGPIFSHSQKLHLHRNVTVAFSMSPFACCCCSPRFCTMLFEKDELGRKRSWSEG